MPDEPSQGGEVAAPEPTEVASATIAPEPVSEPRQSEEARRIQATKDAELARQNKELARLRREHEELRRANEGLQGVLGEYQASAIPDENQRLIAIAQQREAAMKREVIRAEQKAARAEATAKYHDVELTGTELDDALRISKNRQDFDQRVSDMAERKRKDKQDRERLRTEIEEQVRQELRKEFAPDKVATSVPGGTNSGPGAEYQRTYQDAVSRNDPRAIIDAKRRLAAKG